MKDKTELKYASDFNYGKGGKEIMIPGSFGKCQPRTRIENIERLQRFCKGSIIKKGTFKKTYGVKCEVDKDVAYDKSPKECLQCGGRRSKHKRTKKKRKRRRKKKTRKSRKKKRTKRRRKHNKK